MKDSLKSRKSNKKQSYGLAANAAWVRAAAETGIEPERAEEYADLIFIMFEIKGKNSYEKILDILQEENNLQHLAKSIANRNDSKELFQFAKSFLGVEPYKIETDGICKVFKEHSGDDFEEDIDIFFADSNDEYLDFTTIEFKENEVLNILNCEIKTQTLSDMQLFQYIEIPKKPFEELASDFEIAEHLKILSDINDNKEFCGNLMLICSSKDTGLIAMRYLSSLLSEVEGYEDDEIVFSGKLPVVNAEEIDRSMQQDIFNNTTIFSGSLGFQAVQGTNSSQPWWMKYENIPLLILIRKEGYLSEKFVEKLKILGDTHDIFIIAEKDKESVNDTNTAESLFGSDINMIVNDISFTLTYNTYEIEEPEETSEYMKKILRDTTTINSYKIGEDVDVEEILKQLKKNRGKKWEGTLSVTQLIKKAVSLKKTECGVLNKEDFNFLQYSFGTVKNKTNREEKKRKENAVERMNRCIFGLKQVKSAMMEAVNVLEFNRKREKAGLKSKKINNVFAFYGPPGVGKTEMAKYFGDIMIEKNLLTGNRFISINGAQLKGAYVGQTAPKVAAIFQSNDVIFIDECYSLTASDFSMDTFSQEALAELCIQLEKYGNEKLIVFAGYGGEVLEKNNKMKQFLDANPGLSSRITFHVDFPSYTIEEMLGIFEKIAANDDYILEDGWREVAAGFFKEREKQESYGNGREARKLFQHINIAQSTRLSAKSLDKEDLTIIKLEDIKNAVKKILESENRMIGIQKSRIGF